MYDSLMVEHRGIEMSKNVNPLSDDQIELVKNLIYKVARSELGCVTSGDACEISDRVRDHLKAMQNPGGQGTTD